MIAAYYGFKLKPNLNSIHFFPFGRCFFFLSSCHLSRHCSRLVRFWLLLLLAVVVQFEYSRKILTIILNRVSFRCENSQCILFIYKRFIYALEFESATKRCGDWKGEGAGVEVQYTSSRWMLNNANERINFRYNLNSACIIWSGRVRQWGREWVEERERKNITWWWKALLCTLEIATKKQAHTHWLLVENLLYKWCWCVVFLSHANWFAI